MPFQAKAVIPFSVLWGFRAYFAIVSILCSLAFFPVKAKALSGDFNRCIQLLSSQRVLPELPETEIQVAGQRYAVDRLLGESTARVLLTKDRKSVIKVFPPSQVYAARLEYWTTIFYLSHSLPALNVLNPPFETVFDGKPVVALVKPYVEGVTSEEFEKLCKENQSASLDCAELRQQKEALRSTLRQHHAEGKFIAWLGNQGVKIDEEFGPLVDTLDFVDLTDSNFLLTANVALNGWVVIDP